MSNTSEIVSAPRSLEGLLKLSAYKLRLLADQLGALATESMQMAWHDQNAQQRAESVLRLLQEWDKQHGGPPAQSPPQEAPKAAAPPAAPMGMAMPMGMPGAAPPIAMPGMQGYPAAAAAASPPPPPVQGPGMPTSAPMGAMPMGMPIPMSAPMMPMQPNMVPGAPPMVPPGATAAAAAASADTATAGKRGRPARTPVHTNGTAAPTAPMDANGLGTEVLNALNRILEQGGDLKGTVESFNKTLLEAASLKDSRAAAAESHYKQIAESLQALDGSIKQLQSILIWVLVLQMNTAASTNGVSPVEVLSEAIQTSGMFNQLYAKATGKG